MRTKLDNLVQFLRDAGYPSLADNFEQGSSMAATIRKKTEGGGITDDERKFLEFQAQFEASLDSIPWL